MSGRTWDETVSPPIHNRRGVRKQGCRYSPTGEFTDVGRQVFGCLDCGHGVVGPVERGRICPGRKEIQEMKLYEEMKKYTDLVEQKLEGFTVTVLFRLTRDSLRVKIYARQPDSTVEWERSVDIVDLDLTTAKCDILEDPLLCACASIQDSAATS